ncbi:MAG: tetratricopeptide repeat protein [Myxococcales bacterium]|nr:tetratricopeptide repeat protein [Myxococcales bacterium]
MAAEETRIATLRAMVAEDDTNELAIFSLGQALFEAGDFAAAERSFARAAALQDDLMMAWLRRAECLVRLKRPGEARPCAERGLRLAVEQKHDGPRADAGELLDEIDELLDEESAGA